MSTCKKRGGFYLVVLSLIVNVLINSFASAGALHQAVGLNDVNVVRTLLKQGVDVDEIDSDGFTALQLAVQAGNVDIAEILVSNKANLDIQSHYCPVKHLRALKAVV